MRHIVQAIPPYFVLSLCTEGIFMPYGLTVFERRENFSTPTSLSCCSSYCFRYKNKMQTSYKISVHLLAQTPDATTGDLYQRGHNPTRQCVDLYDENSLLLLFFLYPTLELYASLFLCASMTG